MNHADDPRAGATHDRANFTLSSRCWPLSLLQSLVIPVLPTSPAGTAHVAEQRDLGS